MTLAGVGLLDFTAAFAVILGDNIGTTITAQLAALNANITAKRTAWAHTMIKVIGAAYMLPLLFVRVDGKPVFLFLVNLVTPGNVWIGENIERHVANTHLFFNLINCLLLIPFTGAIVYLVTKMVRGEVEVIEHGSRFLDERMIVTPEIAIGQSKKEIVRMLRYAEEQFNFSLQSIHVEKHRDRERLFEKIRRREEVVNLLEREISSFIIKIDQQSITEEQSRTTAGLLHLIHDVERIGDIAENVMDLMVLKEEENIKFSEVAIKEIRTLSDYVRLAVSLTIEAFEKWDKNIAHRALEIEGKVDATEQQYRDNHIKRLGKAACDPTAGVVFLDILSNLERTGDHAHNISKKILEINSFA